MGSPLPVLIRFQTYERSWTVVLVDFWQKAPEGLVARDMSHSSQGAGSD